MGCVVGIYYLVALVAAWVCVGVGWWPIAVVVVAVALAVHVYAARVVRNDAGKVAEEPSPVLDETHSAPDGDQRGAGRFPIRSLIAVPVIFVVGAMIVGAAMAEPEPEPSYAPAQTYTGVVDRTGSQDYRVRDQATGGQNLVGGWDIELQFEIANPNQTYFDPVVTVTSTTGGQVVCRADDLRRRPFVRLTTTDWEFPCSGALPDPNDTASIVVTDSYE